MDVDDIQGQVAERLEQSGTESAPPAPQETPAEPQQPEAGQGSEDYSLANNFLENVPEEHRELLSEYVKKWDASVTRRFQDIHNEYRPYKELGANPEQLQQAYQLYELMVQNPEQVYELLAQDYGPQGQQPLGQETQTQEVPGEFQLPPEYLQRFEKIDTMEKALQQIASHIMTEQQQKKQAEEDRQLEQYLNNLKVEFGDFDEDYVLTKMNTGMSGEDAVKAFQKIARPAAPPPPPVLSGGGSNPKDPPIRPSEIPEKDLKDFVAHILEQSNQT